MKRTLKNYRALPYSRRAEGIHEDDGSFYWVAWIHELLGCKTDGATYAEAMLNLDTAFDDYIEAMLEFGSDIPVPKRAKGKKSPSREIKTFREVSYETIVPTQEEFNKKKAMPMEGTIKSIENREETIGTTWSIVLTNKEEAVLV